MYNYTYLHIYKYKSYIRILQKIRHQLLINILFILFIQNSWILVIHFISDMHLLVIILYITRYIIK